MECTFTTGYLTHKGRTESGKYRLVIPNREVRNLLLKNQRVAFRCDENDGETLDKLCNAFVNKELEKLRRYLVIISGIRSVYVTPQLPKKRRKISIMVFYSVF